MKETIMTFNKGNFELYTENGIFYMKLGFLHMECESQNLQGAKIEFFDTYCELTGK